MLLNYKFLTNAKIKIKGQQPCFETSILGHLYAVGFIIPKIRAKKSSSMSLFNVTTESITSASYLDLVLSIRNDGPLHNSVYDKRDDFNFQITNFRS